jgi:NAD(P)-dependent dehydrogenase (short-subunit alcohol dehydrogenase family)
VQKKKMELEGRVAIVTGSSQGIGKGIALALAQAGARVVVNYVSNRELAEETADAARLMGVQALVVGADVSQRADVERLFSRALETFGRIDILVNNAAAFQPVVPLVELSEADWDRVMSVNLKGSFLCAQVAARQMIRQQSGVIINISSLGSQVLMHNLGAYCASKGGLETLTRALALELAPHGIRVNAIAPGHIATAGNLNWVAAAAGREERFRARIALGRLGKIEEIGSTAVFLASDASGYITGQILYADGGIMMWQGPILD